MFMFIENDTIINSHYIIMSAYYFEESTEEHFLKFIMANEETFFKKFDSKEEAIHFLVMLK